MGWWGWLRRRVAGRGVGRGVRGGLVGLLLSGLLGGLLGGLLACLATGGGLGRPLGRLLGGLLDAGPPLLGERDAHVLEAGEPVDQQGLLGRDGLGRAVRRSGRGGGVVARLPGPGGQGRGLGPRRLGLGLATPARVDDARKES